MEEPIIGNGGQTVPCFLIVSALRLLREIAAGHDERPVHVPQQQMVQGCIGQHESERWMLRRHALATRSGPVAGKITIGAAALLSSASS